MATKSLHGIRFLWLYAAHAVGTTMGCPYTISDPQSYTFSEFSSFMQFHHNRHSPCRSDRILLHNNLVMHSRIGHKDIDCSTWEMKALAQSPCPSADLRRRSPKASKYTKLLPLGNTTSSWTNHNKPPEPVTAASLVISAQKWPGKRISIHIGATIGLLSWHVCTWQILNVVLRLKELPAAALRVCTNSNRFFLFWNRLTLADRSFHTLHRLQNSWLNL